MGNQNDGGQPRSAVDGSKSRPVNPVPRTIVATVLVNGVPTPVRMEVVALSDSNDIASSANQIAMLKELRAIRVLLAKYLGEPFIFDPLPDDATGGIV
jgi:hypothetical protein